MAVQNHSSYVAAHADQADQWHADELDELHLRNRGWAMRHGRRKRFARQAWSDECTAAASASDAPSLWGRSVFKRSANSGSRLPTGHRSWYNKQEKATPGKRRAKLHRFVQMDATEVLEWYDEPGVKVEDFDADDTYSRLCEEEREASLPFPLEVAAWSDDSSCTESDGFCSAVSVSTAASMEGSFCDKDGPSHATRKTVICVVAQPSRWEDALERARRAAETYFADQHQHGPNSKRGKEKQTTIRLRVDQQNLVTNLRRKHDATLVCDTPASDSERGFSELRWKFMEQHGPLICEHLRRLFNSSFSIRFTPLSRDVASAFMKACQGGLVGELRPVYHGTSEANLPSIYSQGLLIPGSNNGIRVANGSAHGLGVYTAEVTNPELSRSYVRCGSTQKLLICGVIDDVGHSTAPEVKHAGSAVVVFNPVRVAPLFEAACPLSLPPPAPNPPFAAARRAAALEKPMQQRRKSCRLRGPAKLQLTNVAKFLARRAARRRRNMRAA